MKTIDSGLPREIAAKKIKEFLDIFQIWRMLKKVEQVWDTEFSVTLLYTLKDRNEDSVKISVNEDSSVLIECEKKLVIEYFLLELGKKFKSV